MDQSTHDVRRASWFNIITECQQRPVNVSVKQWLADNGIKEKHEAADHTVAVIRADGITLEVSGDISGPLCFAGKQYDQWSGKALLPDHRWEDAFLIKKTQGCFLISSTADTIKKDQI